jgi:peptide deformylase
MALPIVHFDSPVLRQKGEKVNAFDSSLAALAEEMIETMHEADGIGLAAQQIGKAMQFCVVDLRGADEGIEWKLDGRRPPLDLFMPLAMANPTFDVLTSQQTAYEEGCLSFPEIRGEVFRPDAIRARFQDLTGAWHELECTGLLSRCIQHEIDHLNGVLFIDRMDPKVVKALEPDLRHLRKLTRKASQG